MSEISMAKDGLKRCPYLRRSPSAMTRTTSGSVEKSIPGGLASLLSPSDVVPRPSDWASDHWPRASMPSISARVICCQARAEGRDCPFSQRFTEAKETPKSSARRIWVRPNLWRSLLIRPGKSDEISDFDGDTAYSYLRYTQCLSTCANM